MLYGVTCMFACVLNSHDNERRGRVVDTQQQSMHSLCVISCTASCERCQGMVFPGNAE